MPVKVDGWQRPELAEPQPQGKRPSLLPYTPQARAVVGVVTFVRFYENRAEAQHLTGLDEAFEQISLGTLDVDLEKPQIPVDPLEPLHKVQNLHPQTTIDATPTVISEDVGRM